MSHGASLYGQPYRSNEQHCRPVLQRPMRINDRRPVARARGLPVIFIAVRFLTLIVEQEKVIKVVLY